jgi:uncharacterized protein (TIGR03085 family)
MAESGSNLARSERLALCELLEDKGPLAPTLCEGWATADLAAHLFIRENRPWYGAGILIKSLASLTERGMDEAKRQLGYEGLVRKIRSGPPGPLKVLDAQMNLIEFFVHHEDVRRAGPEPAAPRSEPLLEAGLWSILKRSAFLLTWRLRSAGLEVSAPGHGSFVARKGFPRASLAGPPGELVLYLYGRKRVAEVELAGPEAAVAAVDETSFGL